MKKRLKRVVAAFHVLASRDHILVLNHRKGVRVVVAIEADFKSTMMMAQELGVVGKSITESLQETAGNPDPSLDQASLDQ